MSVNGTGKDRKTGKDLTDPTTWTVKFAGGEVATIFDKKEKKEKTLSGVSAETAFAAVRNFRLKDIFAAAVRS